MSGAHHTPVHSHPPAMDHALPVPLATVAAGSHNIVHAAPNTISMDKSLFPFHVNGWLVGGALALAGVAAATFAYLNNQRLSHEKVTHGSENNTALFGVNLIGIDLYLQAKRRQHFLRLRSSFNSERNAVIEHVYESPWCQCRCKFALRAYGDDEYP